MTSYNEFCSEFPIKELNIKEKTFQYRHYNNPDSEITLTHILKYKSMVRGVIFRWIYSSINGN